MKFIDRTQEFVDVLRKYGSPRPGIQYPIHAFLLQYVFFEVEPDEQIDFTAINRKALETIAEREVYLFEETNGEPSRKDRFIITYHNQDITSRPITVEQFLGPRYDLGRQKLILQGKDRRFYYVGTQEESPETSIDIQQREREVQNGEDIYEGNMTRGYADAFTDPVHSLQLNDEDKEAFLHDVNAVVFDSFKDELDILQWSTNWSSYFDAGHEWWGAYWWTIHNKTKNQIIVIAASGTD